MEEIPRENIRNFDTATISENEDATFVKIIISGVFGYILLLLAVPFFANNLTGKNPSDVEPVLSFEPQQYKLFLMKQDVSVSSGTEKESIINFEVLEASKSGQLKIIPKYSDKEWKAAIGSSEKFALSSDGEKIACCLNDKEKSLVLIHTSTGKIFKSFKNAKCSHVNFTPDNKHAIYIEQGKSSTANVIVKNISDGLAEKEFKMQFSVPQDSKFPHILPQKDLIIYLKKAEGSDVYEIMSVNPKDPVPSSNVLLSERETIRSLSVSPDGKLIAYATDSKLFIFDAAKTAHNWQLPVVVKSFTWDEDSEHILYLEAGKEDGQLDLKKVEIFSDLAPEVIAKNLNSSIVKIWQY